MDALKEPETTVVFRSHSGDTDIMVLAVALLRSDCERLYINYGNGKNRKAICLDDIMMNEKKKDALLGFYTFSGNDYVSGFFRKDISSGWECMVKTEKFVQLFADLSKSWELEESHLLLLEEFLCNLYGCKCRNTNLIQHKMFQKRVTQNKQAPNISLLPPRRSVFQLHARRAIFVANMWRSTPTAWLILPNFTRFGWDADGFPIWINEAYPDDVSELLLTENLDIEDDDDLDLDENIDDSSDKKEEKEEEEDEEE